MRQATVTVGQQVAGYRVESMVARGGMAVVYRATEVQLARSVALKVLSPDLSESAEFEQRFIGESQLAASCDHPNIIPIYSAGEADGLLYIAMRYVDGLDLAGVLKRDGAIDPSRALMIFRQVASALDAAHDRGLVHRDVKPGNILVASGGGREVPDHVYLTDFGVTKKAESMSGLTAAGSFVGTLDYISPEQISGGSIDARTDVYSLGCVVYQALTGTVPFRRDGDAGMLWAHLSDQPPPPSSLRPELGPDVDDVLDTAMAKQMDDRFHSCRALVDALHSALERSTVLERDSPTVIERPQTEPGPGRHSSPGSSGPRTGPSRPTASARSGPDTSGTPTTGSGATRSAATRPPGGRQDPATALASDPPEPSRPRRRYKKAALTALGVVAVAVAALVFVVLPSSSSSKTTKYNGLHYTTVYPSSWTVGYHGAGNTQIYQMFYPAKAALADLLDDNNGRDGWSNAATLLQDDPAALVGVYIAGPQSGSGTESTTDVRDKVQGHAGASVTMDPAGAQQTTVNGYQATAWLGTMTNNGGVSLRFRYLRVAVPSSSLFEIIEFGEQTHFAPNQPNFDLITSNFRVTS